MQTDASMTGGSLGHGAAGLGVAKSICAAPTACKPALHSNPPSQASLPAGATYYGLDGWSIHKGEDILPHLALLQADCESRRSRAVSTRVHPHPRACCPIRPAPTNPARPLLPQAPAAWATSTRTWAPAGMWPPSPTPRPSLPAPAGGLLLGGRRVLPRPVGLQNWRPVW